MSADSLCLVFRSLKSKQIIYVKKTQFQDIRVGLSGVHEERFVGEAPQLDVAIELNNDDQQLRYRISNFLPVLYLEQMAKQKIKTYLNSRAWMKRLSSPKALTQVEKLAKAEELLAIERVDAFVKRAKVIVESAIGEKDLVRRLQDLQLDHFIGNFIGIAEEGLMGRRFVRAGEDSADKYPISTNFQ